MRRKKSKFTEAEVLHRAIAAWEKRQESAVLMLRKSAEMLVKLRRQRARLLKRTTVESKISDELITSVAETLAAGPTARDVVWPSGKPVQAGDLEPGSTIEIEVETGIVTTIEPPVDDDIPTFLDRTGEDKDAAARAEIEAQQAANKKRKAERHAAKRKINQETKHAELTGQRRKMPLSGRAALAAIDGK